MASRTPRWHIANLVKIFNLKFFINFIDAKKSPVDFLAAKLQVHTMRTVQHEGPWVCLHSLQMQHASTGKKGS